MRAHLSIACVRLTTEACEARASTRVREQSITAASIPIIVTKSTETYLRRRARDARLHGVRNTTMAFSSTEFHRCVFLCLSLYSVHTSSHARRENKTTPRRTDISIASARTQRDSYTHSVMVSCVYASRFTLRSYTHTHTHSLTHTAIIYTHSPTAGHALPCECCTADFRYQPYTYDTCMSTHVHTSTCASPRPPSPLDTQLISLLLARTTNTAGACLLLLFLLLLSRTHMSAAKQELRHREHLSPVSILYFPPFFCVYACHTRTPPF